jgi:hypothetical protein
MKIFDFKSNDKFDFVYNFNYWIFPTAFGKFPLYSLSIVFTRSSSIEKYYYIEIISPNEDIHTYDIYTGQLDKDVL